MKRGMAIVLLLSVAIMVPGKALVAAQLAGAWDETLYLTDSADPGDGITILYEVGLDRFAHRAHLYTLPVANLDPPLGPGEVPYNQVDALAATPDGTKLYLVDKYLGEDTGHLGCYDLTIAVWTELGQVTLDRTPIPGIVLAAFSPSGVLYVASGDTESLYTLDLITAELTLVGLIKKDGPTGTPVNLGGADFVFSGENTIYLWANRSRDDAPRGLYLLTLPPVDGAVVATYLGTSTASNFTGLTTLPGYENYLVASTHEDEVLIMNKSNGQALGAPFMVYRDGIPYDYEFGDMTTGKSMLCTKTIGYWKNHSWNGATVTICDAVIDEALGNEILWNAKGTNFSMLFAQFIAARLNCDNCRYEWAGIYVETWLCNQPGIVNPDGSLYWDMPFASEKQKDTAEKIWSTLDWFNNQFECD